MDGALGRALPREIRSRLVGDVNGLTMHVLECGHEPAGRPVVFLLHGFPELAFSWRGVMVRLAAAGFHVIAPDQRGFGRTTGWDVAYDTDLGPYRLLDLAGDMVALARACAVGPVAAVVGHDFGSPVAAWCALARPDLFRSVVLMSAPFGGPPVRRPVADASGPARAAALAALSPPRVHYQDHYCSRGAAADLSEAPQGLHAFLRAYFHHKSADWSGNRPVPLARTVEALATMPRYYVMDLGVGMAETVSAVMPSASEIESNTWLPDSDLAVFTEEFGRTGFQGGLNWYRAGAVGGAAMDRFAGRTIDQPSMFIAGASDWGTYQAPGLLERMRHEACSDFQGVHLVDGAGHWVQLSLIHI